MKANDMSDPSQLTVGQTIIIPTAATPEPQWQVYIGTQKSPKSMVRLSFYLLQKTENLCPRGSCCNLAAAESLIGREGDKVSLEAAVSPDKSFGGLPHPALCWRRTGRPRGWRRSRTGRYKRTNTAAPETNTPPTRPSKKWNWFIFVSNPLYQPTIQAEQALALYSTCLAFFGSYSNGDAFDILIQALEQKFLSPEIAPTFRAANKQMPRKFGASACCGSNKLERS